MNSFSTPGVGCNIAPTLIAMDTAPGAVVSSNLSANGPDASSVESLSNWKLNGTVLSPTVEHILKLHEHLSLYDKDDPVFRFVFAPEFEAVEVLVNKSRLDWAGGPLAALATPKFKEGNSNTVRLSDDDHPVAYYVLRDFLYARNVNLSIISTIESAMCTLKCADFWNLKELVHHVSLFVQKRNMLSDVDHFVRYVDDAALDKNFQSYFWSKVGEHFDKFAEPDPPEDKSASSDTAKGSVEEQILDEGLMSSTDDAEFQVNKLNLSMEAKLCPKFPNLWPCAVEQNMCVTVVHSLLTHTNRELRSPLLDLIIQYLEPSLQGDDKVIQMIQLVVGRRTDLLRDILNKSNIDLKCSTRAMRLLAKCIAYPRHNEGRFSWTTCLVGRDLHGNLAYDSSTFYFCTPATVEMLGTLVTFTLELRTVVGSSGKTDAVFVSWRTIHEREYSMTAKVTVSEDVCHCRKRMCGAERIAGTIVEAPAQHVNCEGDNGRLCFLLKKENVDNYCQKHKTGGKFCQVRILLEVNLS